MRLRSVLISLIIVAPLSIFATCYAAKRSWWEDAEAAISATVVATAENRQPQGISTKVLGDSMHVPRQDFRLPCQIEGADNFLRGTSLLDLLSPGVYVAHLRFSNGSLYHVEARREGLFGAWIVSLQPAEARS